MMAHQCMIGFTGDGCCNKRPSSYGCINPGSSTQCSRQYLWDLWWAAETTDTLSNDEPAQWSTLLTCQLKTDTLLTHQLTTDTHCWHISSRLTHAADTSDEHWHTLLTHQLKTDTLLTRRLTTDTCCWHINSQLTHVADTTTQDWHMLLTHQLTTDTHCWHVDSRLTHAAMAVVHRCIANATTISQVSVFTVSYMIAAAEILFILWLWPVVYFVVHRQSNGAVLQKISIVMLNICLMSCYVVRLSVEL